MPTLFDLDKTLLEVRDFGHANQKRLAQADNRAAEAASEEAKLTPSGQAALAALLALQAEEQETLLLVRTKRGESDRLLATAKTELAKLADKDGPYKPMYDAITAAAANPDDKIAVARAEHVNLLLAAVDELKAIADQKGK